MAEVVAVILQKAERRRRLCRTAADWACPVLPIPAEEICSRTRSTGALAAESAAAAPQEGENDGGGSARRGDGGGDSAGGGNRGTSQWSSRRGDLFADAVDWRAGGGIGGGGSTGRRKRRRRFCKAGRRRR